MVPLDTSMAGSANVVPECLLGYCQWYPEVRGRAPSARALTFALSSLRILLLNARTPASPLVSAARSASVSKTR